MKSDAKRNATLVGNRNQAGGRIAFLTRNFNHV
jgi:hypothetical protein